MNGTIDVVEFYYKDKQYSYCGEILAGENFKTLDKAITDMEQQASIYDPKISVKVTFDEMDTSEAEDDYIGFIAVHWIDEEE